MNKYVQQIYVINLHNLWSIQSYQYFHKNIFGYNPK